MNADMRPALLLLTVLVVLGVWLVWNVLNVLHVAVGLRDGDWRRPMWWTRLCSVSLFTGFIVWALAIFVGGPSLRDACPSYAGENYNGDYVESHREEYRQLFPLHRKCNADYDLVPVWVNPTVGICALVAAVSVAVLLWFAATRVFRRVRTENARGR